MAVNIQTLFEIQQIPSIATSFFQAQAATRIDKMTLTNVGASFRVVNIYWVPGGGAWGITNLLIPARVLQVNETWDVQPFMGHTLTRGDSIWASCDSAAAVNFVASGTVISS